MVSKKQIVEEQEMEIETRSEEEIVPQPAKARKKRTMTPEMLAKLAVARQAALEKRQNASGTKKKERELEKKRKGIESAARAARVQQLEAEIANMQKSKQQGGGPKGALFKKVMKPKKIVVESSSSESDYEELAPKKSKHRVRQYAQPPQPQLDYHEQLICHLFGRS